MTTARETIAHSLTPVPGLEPVAYQYEQADKVIAGLSEAGFSIDLQSTGPDTDALRALVDAAVWTVRPDYGEGVEEARPEGQAISNALNWECPSCRPDVGWVKWERMERVVPRDTGSRVSGEATFHVECGHCGFIGIYDIEGNDLD